MSYFYTKFPRVHFR